MKDMSYIIGRLSGLNELVKILKDFVDKEGTDAEVISVMTDHISAQLDSILSELDTLEVGPEQREMLTGLKERHAPKLAEEKMAAAEEEKPPEKKKEPPPEEETTQKEKLEKHEKTVDDLLKELEGMKSS